MDRYVDTIINSLSTKMNIEKTYIHPEEYGNKKINKAMIETYNDLKIIDSSQKKLAIKVEDVLSRTLKRLEVVNDSIQSEKERLQDISMLCNAKTDYDNVAPLDNNDFTGDFSYEEGVFFSKLSGSSYVNCIVDNVEGNGYEGNKYVKKDTQYLEEIINSKNKKFITDGNISTYWEYSRITASNTEPYLIADFNTDNAEAKATVTLKFANKANELSIKTTSENIKVIGIRYSNDGLNYEDIEMMPFVINNKQESYKEEGYIYGSNIISFPNSLYVKITFESIGYENEVLAFERVVSNESEKIEKITTVVPTAKRHVIKINDISVKSKIFAAESVMKSNELISEDTNVYAISVFANIYLPNGLPKDAVKFTLTINGIDYEVEPVNSHNNGIKIIRFSQGKMPAEYTKYIGEKIQSAFLKITLKSKGQICPYINNLKILYGGEI